MAAAASSEAAAASSETAALVALTADGSAALLDRLNAIAGVEAKALAPTPSTPPGVLEFALTIDQPVDHANPSGEHFRQRLVLRHRGEGRPMSLALSGYDIGSGTRTFDTDVSALLGGNALLVEHRFYGASTPASRDFRLLTIEQDAADDHHIVEALKTIYGGPWVSEGGSKGGMTALYHRRFFPDDVAGTVAYVAPNSYGRDDPRYALFLEKVGDRDCRERLVGAQREALARRDELLAEMTEFAAFFGLTYDVLGMDVAFEHTIIESRFYFWQFGNRACADIPPPGASAFDLFVFFLDVAGLGFYLADDELARFESFYYQASTELGYYGPSLGFRLHDLLEYPGTFSQSTYPPDVPKKFVPKAMPDIQLWLATQGRRVMLVYGETDPFTAGAFFLGNAKESYRFVNAGADHITGFAEMSDVDFATAVGALEAWTGVTPAPRVAGRAAGGEAAFGERGWYATRAPGR